MAERGTTGRHRRSSKAVRLRSWRAVVAIATAGLVTAQISWLLLDEPDAAPVGASNPYVTKDDDTYITASATPGARMTTTLPTTRPTVETSSGTPTSAAGSVTPRQTLIPLPTNGSTSPPTVGPMPASTPTGTSSIGSTMRPLPPLTPTPRPIVTTTSSNPQPLDDGNMTHDEARLFKLIDEARTDKGCAPLRRNSQLSADAGREAQDRALSGHLFVTEPSKAAAGGDNLKALAAFDHLMDQSPGTLLDCGLAELGVGRGQASYCATRIIFCFRPKSRIAWVADFNQ